MTTWIAKTQVGDIFQAFYESDDLEAFKTAMVERLTTLKDQFGPDDWDSLEGLLEELTEAETMGDAEFVLHGIYDWADWHRVWLDPGAVNEEPVK